MHARIPATAAALVNAWKVTVKGPDIEGTFVHQRKGWLLNPNPDPIDHWFKGKAKG